MHSTVETGRPIQFASAAMPQECPKRVGEVPQVVARLMATIDQLDAAMAHLSERLLPVRASRPTPDATQNIKDCHGSGCQLAIDISFQIARLSAMAEAVGRLNEELEC